MVSQNALREVSTIGIQYLQQRFKGSEMLHRLDFSDVVGRDSVYLHQ